MSQKTDQDLKDWALWYNEFKKKIPPHDVVKRCEFLELMNDGLLGILTLMAMDIQRLEGRVKIFSQEEIKLLLPGFHPQRKAG